MCESRINALPYPFGSITESKIRWGYIRIHQDTCILQDTSRIHQDTYPIGTVPKRDRKCAQTPAAPAGPPRRQPRWRRRHHQPQSRYPLLARSEFVVAAHRHGHPSLGHVPTPRPRMRERTKAMNGTQSSCVGGWSRSRVSNTKGWSHHLLGEPAVNG